MDNFGILSVFYGFPIMVETNSVSQFSREQKIGFVFMLVFAILAVGLGMLQLRNTVYGPFAPKGTTTNSVLVSDEQAQLKAVDTDHDGLTDYDELYVYSTSPYLPDSDSDKVDDATEIAKGTNPLCAEGKTCSDVAELPATSTATSVVVNPMQGTIDAFNNSVTGLLSTSTAAAATSTGSNTDDLRTLVNDIPALRRMLVATGRFTTTDLEKVSDESLRKLVLDIIAKQSASSTPK